MGKLVGLVNCAGIAPADVPGFIAAQLAGALAAHWFDRQVLTTAA